MAKVYLTPYGVGLGHASRLVMLAERLQKSGTTVKFSSFGEAANFLTLKGLSCISVPPVEFAWSMEGGFSVKNSISHIYKWMANFSRQVEVETRSLALFNPDIVVSDSRLSSVVAAKLLGIPSIIILNQIKLLLSPRLREFKAARIFEKLNGEFLGLMWNVADSVMVPDLPPPYTIAESNLWDVASIAHKLQYIGFASPAHNVQDRIVDKVADSLAIDRSRPIVFIHISGPHQTRMPVVNIALEAEKEIDSKVQYIISEGKPGGSTVPRRIGTSGWYYEWCPVRDEIYHMSDLLVLRGGHVAMSQAIQYGKPFVTIPIDNHGEQLGNSQKASKLGIGIALKQKFLTPNQLSDAILQILADSSYKKRAGELAKLSSKLNGIDYLVNEVRSRI